MKKIISMLLCIVLAASLFSGFALADPHPENGWYFLNEKWYYYKDGVKYRGWLQDDGEWYYFHHGDSERVNEVPYHDSSALRDSFYVAENGRVYYFDSDCTMVTGDKEIDGKSYYFHPSGYLESGWISTIGVVDQVVFEEYSNFFYVWNGKIQTGWKEVDGVWYYLKPAMGIMASDEWVQVKTKWYLFDENGIMLTGEQERNGKTYLLGDSGAMYTGWKKTDDGNWIYYKADGVMAKDEWVMVKTQWYLFDENGIMRTGLLERYDHTYYFNDNGSMATGWKKLDGVWYYFRPAENDNGPAGSMVKDSWVLSGNKWYYIGEDGTMVTGTKEIYSDNSRTYYVYYFNDSGAMQTGWHYVDSAWRFFRIASSDNGPQGSMAKSVWVPAGDKWYYTDNYGAMVLGWKDIGTKTYYFSSEAANYGQMVTGKQVIDGKEYTFGDNGALVK